MSQSLEVNKDLYMKSFPNFKKPDVVAFFSVDEKRNYMPGLAQLKYIKKYSNNCKVNYNLNLGINNAIKKDEDVDEKLDHLLKCLLEFKYFSNPPKKSSSFTDFVCFRGLLTTIMCTPYETQEGWIICAMKKNGVIFLCAKETTQHIKNRKEASPFQKKAMSWGYKFEQYMTCDTVNGFTNTEVPVNEKEELCVMFQTQLENHRLMYGAEMDGVRSESEVQDLKDLRRAEFIELKTSKEIQTQKQDRTFRRYKLIKWWCQSFLVGISTIVCGFRDDEGIVRKLSEFKVSDLPKMSKGLWEPSVCMNFCVEFLNFVKHITSNGNTETVWKFEWNPKNNIRTTEICGPSDLSFLPFWFIESVQKGKST